MRAWYVFVGLAMLTFALTAFVGRVPTELSAAVGLPQSMLHRAGVHLRQAVIAMTDRRDLREELRVQTEHAIDLEEANRRMEIQLEELERLLQTRRSQSPAALMSVPVTGRSTGAASDALMLGVGRVDGVLPGMAVTVPEGLVGVVSEVAGRSSVVRTVLDPQSRVGVTVRGKGGQGVAVGEVDGRIRVDRFIVEQPVEVGDVIETSAVGGLFPRGLRLGVVSEVLPQDPNELRRSFLVSPAVDLAITLDVVLIAPP